MPPEIGNSSVFAQVDANNTSGTQPSFPEGQTPSSLNDGMRALQGAVTREWNWRNPTLTTTGSANAYILTYGTAPAALYNGQRFAFYTNFANTGSATLNINSLGAVTLKKLVAGVQTNLASGDLPSGQLVEVAYNSTGPVFVVLTGVGTTLSTASTTEVLTGTDTAKAATADAIAALWEAGADITDGATITIGEGGYFNLITSTTAITAFTVTTDKVGRTFRCRFNTARTLTHNATSLILPGGANITTAQGDIAQFRSLGSGNVVCEWYSPASAVPLVNIPVTRLNSGTSASSSTFWRGDGTWASAGSGYTLIQTLNPSSVANIDTQDLSGYNVIKLTIYGLTPASAASLTIQKSTDGSTFSDWTDGVTMTQQIDATSTSETYNNNPTGSAMLSQPIGASSSSVHATATNAGWSGTITIYNFNQSEKCFGEFTGLFTNADGGPKALKIRGDFYDSGTTARVKLRIQFNAVNIASGRITVEGIQ